MDMSLLLPAGVGVFYTLVILSIIRLKRQRRSVVGIHTEVGEINFALKEGHTIVGVMETKNAMRFYIGNDVRDEKKYE